MSISGPSATNKHNSQVGGDLHANDPGGGRPVELLFGFRKVAKLEDKGVQTIVKAWENPDQFSPDWGDGTQGCLDLKSQFSVPRWKERQGPVDPKQLVEEFIRQKVPLTKKISTVATSDRIAIQNGCAAVMKANGMGGDALAKLVLDKITTASPLQFVTGTASLTAPKVGGDSNGAFIALVDPVAKQIAVLYGGDFFN